MNRFLYSRVALAVAQHTGLSIEHAQQIIIAHEALRATDLGAAYTYTIARAVRRRHANRYAVVAL